MHMLYGLCGVTLVAALVLGGGTHSGFYGDVFLQLIAIPLLVVALWPAFTAEPTRKQKGRLALALCSALTIVLVLQVLPLPFDVWSGGKALFSDGDDRGFGPPKASWNTLSITPQATWAAAASLIVPLAVFCSVLQLGLRQRMVLCWVLLGFGTVSLVLGFLQVAQGPESGLRFYEFTNPSEAVGLFANRNHFAALLNVTLVLSALWLNATTEASLQSGASKSRSILWLAAAAAFLVAIVAGLMMARSRAGVFIAMAVLAGIVAMILARRSNHAGEDQRHRRRAGRVPLAVVLFAGLFAAQFGMAGLLTRFESDLADDARIPLAKTTFETVIKALPLGTGAGSFVPVYATVEKRDDAMVGFANRAHNDLAEMLLENGIVGAVFGIAFLGWFGSRVWVAWGRPRIENVPDQVLLERAATMIVALLLAHSLADYPLRTTALGATFAFFCAILAAPAGDPLSGEAKPQRHRDRRRPPTAEATAAEGWNAGVHWPEGWQRKEDNT